MSVDINLLEYENTPVKLVALRKTPKIETPGLTIEEVDETKGVLRPLLGRRHPRRSRPSQVR